MHKLNYQLIGERIRFHRENQNKKREELAEALEVSIKFCGDIESGARGMSLKTLERVSNYLNLSTDYILFGDTSEINAHVFLRIIEKCPENKKGQLKIILEQIVESYREE